ncbi:tyrosine-type recombinase/integrase [Rhodoblastus sp. 17X3]|uniref:tyrosine-type recombinase/integrase n=1 Tax=Rhodoblastus sp. 17X3 TaxID=3047026 RepID=UPI0024B64658|nr:site-specific integrase [Rhodoblastus sp. 17X3]MDI9846566.1 tyrosine-type recombinase/integrase [Rhodoblastus sp. 17X3]
MAKDLTVKALDSLKPGAARREIPDGHTRGLFFVLQPSGAGSWALRYRFAGRPKKLTIGPYPAIDLAAARRLASEAVQVIARGDDPSQAKQAAKIAAREEAAREYESVEHVVETFIERYSTKNSKPKYLNETRRLLRKEISGPWKGRRLSSITRADVHALLDKIVDRGSPITANRTLAGFRKLCNWAIERGIIDASPCDKLRAPSAENSRDRVLSDAEIKTAWEAFEAIGWPFGPIAQLLLLTGVRRDEVADARWSEIDLDKKIWTIAKERSKNGLAHEIPLSDAAVKILKALPRISAGEKEGKKSDFVFTTTGKTSVSGFSRAKEQFDAVILDAIRAEAVERGEDADEAKAPARWTLHDLRRTAASGMAGLGIAPHVVEAVLNHKSGTIKGVAAVYNRYSYADEKKAALEAWARNLDAIVSGKLASNVVDLASERG